MEVVLLNLAETNRRARSPYLSLWGTTGVGADSAQRCASKAACTHKGGSGGHRLPALGQTQAHSEHRQAENIALSSQINCLAMAAPLIRDFGLNAPLKIIPTHRAGRRVLSARIARV